MGSASNSNSGAAIVVAEDEGLIKLKKMGIDEWRDAITNLVHSMRPHVFSQDGEMMWRDIKALQHRVTELKKPVAMPNLGHASCASHKGIVAVQDDI